MKRVGQWVIGIGILSSTALLIAEPKSAWRRKTGCSLATLPPNGQYLVAANGTLFPPAFGVTQQSVTAAAGYLIYNGDGTGTDSCDTHREWHRRAGHITRLHDIHAQPRLQLGTAKQVLPSWAPTSTSSSRPTAPD